MGVGLLETSAAALSSCARELTRMHDQAGHRNSAIAELERMGVGLLETSAASFVELCS
jgi:hypothetical protein